MHPSFLAATFCLRDLNDINVVTILPIDLLAVFELSRLRMLWSESKCVFSKEFWICLFAHWHCKPATSTFKIRNVENLGTIQMHTRMH